MSDVLAVRDGYRTQMWIEIIRDCKDSAMSNKEFSSQRGVSEKCFYYWQRKLRQQVIEETAPKLVALGPAAESEELLQISFKGAELKLPVGVDMDAVASLLHSIQGL